MRFTRKQLYIAAGIAGLAAITSLTTVVVATSSNSNDDGSGYGSLERGESADRAAEGGEAADGVGATGSVSLEELYVPNEGQELMRWEWRYSRVPKETWEEDDVSRYWIDPDDISIDYLVEQNDALIEEMFENVP